jgi:hypothetical protein
MKVRAADASAAGNLSFSGDARYSGPAPPPGVIVAEKLGRTKALGPHRRTSQPSKPTNNTHPARPRDERGRGPTQEPQAQSRPPPAADSEEATPSEPDPASTRSQSASPRLLESGRRNEGARGRRVAAGSAAGAPNKLEA